MTYSKVIEERLRFLQFDESTTSTLREVQELFESAIDELLDNFYAHILKQPELERLFSDKETVKRARDAQKVHWLKTLFSRHLGKTQYENAERIGQAHVKIGLVPSWYLDAYCYMLNQFIDLLAERYENDSRTFSRIVQALNKAVFLDINFVIDSYIATKDRSIKEVLRRATHFTEDVKDLNEDLDSVTQELVGKMETLVTNAESCKENTLRFRNALQKDCSEESFQPVKASAFNESVSDVTAPLDDISSKVGALVEDSESTYIHAHEVLNCAGHLSDKVEMLSSRVDELMYGDKLYFDGSSDSGFFSRIKAFVGKHMHS